YYRVPLVLVPQQSEQNLVANRAAELHTGVKLDRDSVNPSSLRAAAEKVLHEERYRQQAARLGQSLRAAGGYQRAADEILALVQ
ncbi:MAG: glycosyl transferase, partial [Anaerolineae bacterium]|nr:glycosyl transferase [Anaerolineae bacterium]